MAERSLMSDLDQEISRIRETLLGFEFPAPAAAPTMREPGLAGAIGAALGNILEPGRAEQFAQRAQQTQRFNAQVQAANTAAMNEYRTNELARAYGVDMAQFQELLELRRSIMLQKMRAESAAYDPLSKKWNLDKIEAGLGREGGQQLGELLIADPSAIATIISGLDAINTEAQAIAWIEAAVAGGEGGEVTRSNTAERIDIAQGQLAERKLENLGDNIRTVSDADVDIINLETAILEADSKLEYGFLRELFSGKDPLDPNDPRLDEPISLKTKIRGKERYTLKQLLALRQSFIYKRERLEQLRETGIEAPVVTDPIDRPAGELSAEELARRALERLN